MTKRLIDQALERYPRFEDIPGIGKSIAGDLRRMGYKRPVNLKGEDPQKMYDKLCRIEGQHMDRCLLYTFRCAVYAVETKSPQPEKLKWWNWKDPS